MLALAEGASVRRLVEQGDLMTAAAFKWRNQLFLKTIEEPVVPGRLRTKGTPENWNDSRMDLHFQPWEDDGYLYFKPADTVFAYYVGDLKA
ncbi:hypothetical protein [Cohnella sp. AR92]|uniref:hypothetical protein n=1 Tax=Cohnella sp. AR92 TaxID=648716 RepID=UPI001EDE7ACE|nr:hypothetical protein [Cohnella sp. AR92]